MKKLSFFLMAMLFSVMSFAQEAIYTLDGTITGGSNGYADASSLTQGNIAWSVTGNTTMSPWRIGGKSITNQDRAVYSKNPLAYNIDKIELTHGTANSITVNSLKLIISDAANGAGETIDVTFKASATTTIDLPEGDYSNKYFKFLYNVTVSDSKNKFVEFKSAKFYAALAEDAVKAPVIKGAEDFISETEIAIEAEDDVTVYYTVDGTEPTTASTVYTAPFTVKETTTVKAVAYRGEKASFVTSATFTQATRVTAAEAAELAMKVASNNALTSVTYVINAYVTSVIDQTLSSGQQRFWVADTKDGGQVLQSYYCNVPQVLKVGDYIQMFGKLTKYNTSPQMKNGDVTILEEPTPEPVKYTVTVTAENGTVTGAGEYEENAEATLTATANEGYEFTCWTSGEDTVSTANPYTFAVTANVALVANFKEVVVEPTTETVYFIDVKKWGKVNAYAWNAGGNNGWPGKAATKEAEQIAGFDVYSFTANAGQYANVIFNNKVGDTGSQTDDLVWTAGKYYWMGVAKNFAGATKEEAEATLAAPLPDAWNIVGDAGLMGKGWDLNAAENAMTKQEDGTYKLEKKDITLTAGTYEYKAAKDHGWDVSVPSGQTNQKLTISKSGIYDVTFVLDVTAKKLTATATLKKEAVVIPTVVIAGDMNSWNQTKDKFTMAADSLTATLKTTLTVKNYGFKMIVGGAWHSDGKTITRAANSTKFTGVNSSTNSTLKADIAGEYLFTWEYATKTLTVTYPALPVKYNVTVTAENGTVTGAGTYEEGKEATLTATAAEGYEFTCWTVGEDTVSTANPYKFTVTADLALVANFELIPPTKYNVTVTAENGTVEGAGEYEENAEATLTATAAEGYEFVNWTVGDSIVSTENPYKFTVTADLALVANFKEVVKAIEVKVTDATATSGEWSIDLAGSWNDQALTIKLWQDNTQGFGSYAPNTETGYYILLGAKELTPTTEGVYADNGDGTFTFTCSATEGTTQYNITVTGNNPTQGGGDEEYPIIDDAITNLTFNLDEEPYSCMGGPSEAYGIELYLVLGEEDGMGTFTLTEASEIYVQGSPATFISGYLTDIDTSAPAANAVIVAKLPDGSTFEFHIAMSSTPVEATVIVVENATLAIDSTFLFNNPVSGDVYEYSLTMSGNWTDSTNTIYLVTVEFPVYDPATTEEQERLANIKVGDFAADDAPFLGMVEDFLTITNVNGVITAKGLVSGNGLAFDITISGSLAQDPSTGVDNINTTVAPVKVIENGQIFIISNGVKYNAQGAQL